MRRSLFNNAERGKFLNQLVTGVREILQHPAPGLTDPNNYHEFCRLLARLKSNYQLGELVMVDNYSESIQLMAKFTVESLQVRSLNHFFNKDTSAQSRYLRGAFLLSNSILGNDMSSQRPTNRF